MKPFARILLCCLLFLCGISVNAQQGLQIANIFRKYSNQKGATYVELSKTLSKTWEIDYYKSLKLSKAEKELPYIYSCLEADSEHAKKIKEVVADGRIQSGYYQLAPVKNKVNRFILFRLGKKGNATLIYIEGEIDSDDLVTLMFNKE